MDCSQFQSNIFAFREGALPEGVLAAAAEHLASCTACQALSDEFSRIEMAMEKERTAEPDPFAATRILERIESEFARPAAITTFRLTRLLQPAALIAAVLCGIMIGTYTAGEGKASADQAARSSENITFLRTNLFISEVTDEDKILVINK